MIVAICGPPGAGKTTVATRVHRRLVERDVDARLLHSDDFSTRTDDRLAARVASGPSDVDAWLVDGTFYRREWRDRFRAVGDVRFVHATASLQTCLERNRERADGIDERGVHVVYREFAALDADLRIDTEELSVAAAVDRVIAALEAWRTERG